MNGTLHDVRRQIQIVRRELDGVDYDGAHRAIVSLSEAVDALADCFERLRDAYLRGDKGP